jgi:hypothetical protein
MEILSHTAISFGYKGTDPNFVCVIYNEFSNEVVLYKFTFLVCDDIFKFWNCTF